MAFRPNVGISPKRTIGPSFMTLVGRITHGEDPATNLAGGIPGNRGAQTQTRQDALAGNKPLSSGFQVRQSPALTSTPLTATLTVSANNFAGIGQTLVLGDRRLHQHVDWAPGGTAELTAQAIVDAINLLGQGWAASRVGAVIDITYAHSMNDVRFEVLTQLLSPVALNNFSAITPGGFMVAGSPDLEPPAVTP